MSAWKESIMFDGEMAEQAKADYARECREQDEYDRMAEEESLYASYDEYEEEEE